MHEVTEVAQKLNSAVREFELSGGLITFQNCSSASFLLEVEFEYTSSRVSH
jgi:hypothetical protein